MRLIDADKLYVDDIPISYKDYCTRESIWDWIESQPTVDPIKHGRWHDVYLVSKQTMTQTCSFCQNSVIANIANVFRFCPSCGAKMDLI